jgi:UDP-N-acetylmuramoyl-L-alanyl-D-glutamate--2,6-diaminopimelate ligase
MLTLKQLFEDFPLEILQGIPADIGIKKIVSDSRKVEKDSLFMAVTGDSTDGHFFIEDAIIKGAAAVVGENPSPSGISVPYIRVRNSRQSLAYLASAFYRHPSRKLTMIGVTGTDGKTTTCNLLYQILLAAGKKVGLISTVNAVIGDDIQDTGFHVTTPDSLEVQGYLAKMVEAGLTHAIIEATSHGLAQFRVDACDFDIGVVTNITHEHLDFHGSYENYRGSKARLFTGLSETGPKPNGNIRIGILNRDDDSFGYMDTMTGFRHVSYGINQGADIKARDIIHSPSGNEFTIVYKDHPVEIKSKLVGAFNVYNCLAAFTAAVVGLGISPEIAVQGIKNLIGIPGRMERIDLGQNFTAIVDFAHTPNALKSALQTARQITGGRLIAVFGSAGLRDRRKRRMMAEVAGQFADIAILTAEDPRTESLDHILEEMAEGSRARGGVERKSFWKIPDRGDAIRLAVQLAKRGDLVIVCGKGHEQSMCFGDTEYPWDDRVALRSALAELLDLSPVKMPFLPTQVNKSLLGTTNL